MEEFSRKHFSDFQIRLVAQILENFLWTGEITGIKRIWDGLDGEDLLTPLMLQIQSEILDILFENEELALKLFSPENSEYWLKRMEVLIERYYAPRNLINVPQPKSSIPKQKSFTEYISGLDYRTRRRLKLVEELIKRGATDGEKAAARESYKRVSGIDYPA